MALDSVLKHLEERVEQLLEAHGIAQSRVTELEQRVGELEADVAASGEATERVGALETQRDELAGRLQKVLELIDSTLGD